MKRFTFIAVALCLAFVMAAPVMALEVSNSGHLRVRGRYMDNPGLDSDAKESKARYDMRFRLQTDFIVNDNLKVTTRMDVLDGYTLGSQDPYTSSEANITFDRAYMTIKSDYGLSQFGRMSGGGWALPFGDFVGEYDRLRHTVVMDNITAGVILQKNSELDYGTAGSTDKDLDVYYGFGVYKAENFNTGLLYAYVRKATVDAAAITKNAFLPYFKGKFGSFGVNAEIIAEIGEVDYDAGAGTDQDIDALSYTVDGTWSSGPFGAELGWLVTSGQDDSNDLTVGNAGYGGIGEDWDKMVIFADVDQLLNASNSGGFGSGTASAAVSTYGVNLWYVGFSYQAMEKMKLWFNIAGATADEQGALSDDDYGTEFDANLAWQLMDGLTYTVRAGFLSTGDAWKDINGITNVDDHYTIYHKLQLSF